MLSFTMGGVRVRGALVWLALLGACGTDEQGDAATQLDGGAAKDAGTREAGTKRDASTSPPDVATPRDASSGKVGGKSDAGATQPDASGSKPDASSATGDAGTARDPSVGGDAGAVPLVEAAPLTTAPTYRGTSGASTACTSSLRTMGYAPVDTTTKHPLFLYFVGTASGTDDVGAAYDCMAARKITEAMAKRGFVALSVEYDNQLGSFLTNKTTCLYDPSNPQSLLSVACAMPSVDCGLGIATWGHSQGALIAHAGANFDARVRATWTTGYSGLDGAKLPMSRFRTVNGEGDTMNASVAVANKTAGFTAAECPDDGREQCLREDGSGWIIVRKSACKVTSADHCWFSKKSCIDRGETLESNWVDDGSTAPFSLGANADWVARTIARP